MNNNKCVLRISSDKIFASEISRCFPKQLKSRILEKGQRLSENNSTSPIRTHSRYVLEDAVSEIEPIANHILYFIIILEENSIGIRGLLDCCEIDLWCTVTS